MSKLDERNPNAPKLRKVHNVHILDASGSMIGRKYESAISGINDEQEKLKRDAEVEYTQTIVEFDRGDEYTDIQLGSNGFSRNGLRLTKHYLMVPIADCELITGRAAEGSTPLYQTVGEMLVWLEMAVPVYDKCLVTIFTDGEENSSEGPYTDPKVLKVLINRLQERRGFTITFMGTQFDVDNMVREVGILSGNTWVHNNCETSISESYSLRSDRVREYARKVSSEAEASCLIGGFFDDIKKDEE